MLDSLLCNDDDWNEFGIELFLRIPIVKALVGMPCPCIVLLLVERFVYECEIFKSLFFRLNCPLEEAPVVSGELGCE